MIHMGFQNIPEELKKLPQWVVRRGKVPYNPRSGYCAKAGQPETWGSFHEAVNESKNYDGIGFEFKTGGGIVGIDLDHIFTDSGAWADGSEWAQNIVNALDTYTEISPSKTGLHIYAYGTIPESGRKKTFQNKQALEMYQEKRYFTVTGDTFHGERIENRNETLNGIYKKYFSEIPQKNHDSTADYQPNDDYMSIGLEKDPVFAALWNGERPNGNESSDDIALMNKLAYWCNKEICSMMNAFLASPHVAQKDDKHKKKLQRQDYLRDTALKAVEDCTRTAAEENKAFHQTQKEKSAQKVADNKKTPTLKIISAPELQVKQIPPLRFVVENFLPQGLVILASPPKYGKSWFVLDLCLSVASGAKFLGHETTQCGCLYLALEDSLRRLQDRMNKVLAGDPAPECFDYSIQSQDLKNGLTEQLEDYMKQKPNTGLIVIDTFQKVRSAVGNSRETSYTIDYKETGQLKSFADHHNICLLLVHHTRKAQADSDIFDKISGTNGILGAADAAFVMDKQARFSEKTVLSITGRDIEQNEITLEFDKISYRWKFLGNTDDLLRQSLRMQYNSDPVVATIKDLLKMSPETGWSGSPQDLLDKCMELENSRPADSARAMSAHITAIHNSLFDYDRIIHTAPKYPTKGKGRVHSFRYSNTSVNFNPYDGEQLTVCSDQ